MTINDKIEMALSDFLLWNQKRYISCTWLLSK